MSAKKTILILCDWFLPGYLAGGPIQSIATLTQQLGNDIDFKIITTDRDFKSNESYKNIRINEWTVFEGRTVFYVSPENMNPKFLLKLIQNTSHDTIYLNSLFSIHFAVNPLKWKLQRKINSKIILAPRGMLGEGALAIKPTKKKIFLMFAKLFGLFKNVHWQSTSFEETEQIKKHMGTSVLITQVSNIPCVTSNLIGIEKVPGKLRLCFIARILDVKNLIFAIDVLKKVTSEQIVFDVYGPIEDVNYWNLCKENANELPRNCVLNYKGVLIPSEISKAISNYHALFLPTHTENFGHVIVETLQCARPVIISDQTPWRNLEKENAGFDLPLSDENKFIDAIHRMSQLNQTEFNVICEGSSSFINSKLNLKEIKAQYIKLFLS